MARIIFCHPAQTRFDYHIYTDLDFWDARRLLKDLAVVKRNFGLQPSGDAFPTQVVQSQLSRSIARAIEGRLRKAIASPPRHVVVRSMLFDGFFEFDPLAYYPGRWSKEQMLRFTYHRLPLQQGVISNPYQTVQLSWIRDLIRVEKVPRARKYDPVIRTEREARRWLHVPSCF